MISTAFAILFSLAMAQIPEPTLLKSDGVTLATLEESLASVRPGSILVVGEEHGAQAHQNYQMRILNFLRAQGLKVSVGMEFVTYPHQAHLDAYRFGMMNEADFLKSINWGTGFDFSFYREQILFPSVETETTLALNLPRSISSQIAKGGLSSLTPDQARLLPPRLEKGNPGYFRRFVEAMGGHFPNEQAKENYFLAQCSWDDTMAWKATEFITDNPEQVLVIVVGEFHVQYAGGLPDRLKVWGAKDVQTVSLINVAGLSSDEKNKALMPSTEDGPRADFLWISEF